VLSVGREDIAHAQMRIGTIEQSDVSEIVVVDVVEERPADVILERDSHG
jgi:hypothetical protein